mgnify:CR=1 FL=1
MAVRLGINPLTWTNDDMPELGSETPLETCLAEAKLAGFEGPVVAVSDWATDVADQIRQFVPGDYSVLGADGFGFSDTRAAARRYFGIDRESVVVRVLERLAAQGKGDPSVPREAAERYQLRDVNAGTTGGAGGES